MIRFLSLRRIALASAVLSVLTLAVSRAAAQEVPFSVEGTFTFTVLHGKAVDVTGEGHASPGGAFTFHDVVQLEYGFRVVEGTLTFVFASGSTLSIFYEAPIDETGFVSGPYVVVDGTGLFEGTSGSGIIEYPIGQGAPFWMDGTLNF